MIFLKLQRFPYLFNPMKWMTLQANLGYTKGIPVLLNIGKSLVKILAVSFSLSVLEGEFTVM